LLNPFRLAFAAALAGPVGILVWGVNFLVARSLFPVYWCYSEEPSGASHYCWQTAATVCDWVFGILLSATGLAALAGVLLNVGIGKDGKPKKLLAWNIPLRWLLFLPIAILAAIIVQVMDLCVGVPIAMLRWPIYPLWLSMPLASFMMGASFVGIGTLIAPREKFVVASVLGLMYSGCVLALSLLAWNRPSLMGSTPPLLYFASMLMNVIGAVVGGFAGVSLSRDYNDGSTPIGSNAQS